jgi:hypothetical protein
LPRFITAAASEAAPALWGNEEPASPAIPQVTAKFMDHALLSLRVFLLSRPYQGILHDGYIYIGRALADLDPNGVGRDLMFVHDGQFGFSVFRFAATAFAALLGPALAAKALVLAAELARFSRPLPLCENSRVAERFGLC